MLKIITCLNLRGVAGSPNPRSGFLWCRRRIYPMLLAASRLNPVPSPEDDIGLTQQQA